VPRQKIAEANSKIIQRLWQLFAKAKIVEFRGLNWMRNEQTFVLLLLSRLSCMHAM
jgi:hypothetical protein